MSSVENGSSASDDGQTDQQVSSIKGYYSVASILNIFPTFCRYRQIFSAMKIMRL